MVRAAAASTIPLISAVGHETDWTLIDHAADVRAPTPTGAAEMAVPVRRDLLDRLGDLERRLTGAAERGLDVRRTRLLAAARALPKPGDVLALPRQRFDAAALALVNALKANTTAHCRRFERVAARLGIGDWNAPTRSSGNGSACSRPARTGPSPRPSADTTRGSTAPSRSSTR